VCVGLYLHSWGYDCLVSSLQLQGQVGLYLCELLCMVRLSYSVCVIPVYYHAHKAFVEILLPRWNCDTVHLISWSIL
jgi:hypothetical protein